MSVVIGIKDKDKVWIGTDTQITKGGCKYNTTNPNNFKVWNVNGVPNCIMAHVGSVVESNAIKVMCNLVSEITVMKDEIDYEYVITRIVPRMYQTLEDCDYLNHLEGKYKSSYLFAYKDKLFYIASDWSVTEIDDFIAIGSGECEAIGSLYATKGLEVEERIKKAIEVCSKHDTSISLPIVVKSTEDYDYQIIKN